MESRIRDYRYKWYSRLMARYRFSSVSLPVFNPWIRLVLRLRYLYHRTYLAALYHGRKDEIRRWLDSNSFFFGFAVSRSGTSFLGNFLSRENPDSIIMHEANIIDLIQFPDAMISPEAAFQYIDKYRLRYIYHRARRSSFRMYGEISPHLRQHCIALGKAIPEARMFHMVRNGKDVVSSLQARGRFSGKDPVFSILEPPASDPYSDQWTDMTSFQRICWLWQRDNRYLRENVGMTVCFENLIGDYTYFRNRLLDHLQMDISEEKWSSYVSRPVNVTPAGRRPRWQDWSGEEKTQFREICGAEMDTSGYSLE